VAGGGGDIFAMKIPTDNSPDYHDAEQHAAALLAETDILRSMVPAIATARAVLAYGADRLKRALALAVSDAKAALYRPSEKAPSFAALESHALASTAYRDAVDALQASEEAAERTSAEWQARLCKIDALRTVVALERAKAQML